MVDDPVSMRRREILAQAKTQAQEGNPLWGGYVNMLKTLGSAFFSPKQWALEFLQNSEDSRATKLLIELDDQSLKVFNDGHPFTKEDFWSITDVQSRKLPAQGFLGYIGVGFKSIFRVSDCVEVHSESTEFDCHFKFDRSERATEVSDQPPASKWPWEILPIQIGPLPLPSGYNTGFVVSLAGDKGKAALGELKEFLSKKFPKEAMITLHKVKEIRIRTSDREAVMTEAVMTAERQPKEITSGSTMEAEVVRAIRTVVSPGERSDESRFLKFEKVVSIDPGIRADGETERVHRADVTERRIGLIFGLDDDDHIKAIQGDVAGVYSFLPVESEQTGLPFALSADFIPHIGRDLINYSAQWNQWMCKQLVTFFEEVVAQVFTGRPDSGEWFLAPAEILSHVTGQGQRDASPIGDSEPAGKKFWRQHIGDKVREFLESQALYPDADGVLRKLDEFEILSDEIKPVAQDLGATVSLLRAGVEPDSRVASLISEAKRATGEKLVNQLDRDTLVYRATENRQFLQALKEHPQSLARLYALLLELDGYRLRARDGREGRAVYYRAFVLADDGEFYQPDEVVCFDVEPTSLSAFLRPFVPQGKRVLHPALQGSPEAIEGLRKCGLVEVSEPELMDRLRTTLSGSAKDLRRNSPWSSMSEMIEATLFLVSRDKAKGRYIGINLCVADDGTVVDVQHALVPGTPLDWTKVKDYLLPDYHCLHSSYFDLGLLAEYTLTTEQVQAVFREHSAHGFESKADGDLIKLAAQNMIKERLRGEGCVEVEDVSWKGGLGCDLVCKGAQNLWYEVKGMVEPGDVSLRASEVELAKEKRHQFVLACVYGLPNAPEVKEIHNPKELWEPMEVAKIPKEKWHG